MKAIADGFADAGAEIIGVVPDFSRSLVKHEGCTQVIHTQSSRIGKKR